MLPLFSLVAGLSLAAQVQPPPPSETPSRPQEPAGPTQELEEETVVGTSQPARDRLDRPAYALAADDLERTEYDDIHRVLRQVPGVHLREEDGYGLRPNIGIRGTSTERSAKVTLMEDGVLLAPAPYSAPAAYYFPLTTRMTGVEAFMGPEVLGYGPFTTGGAINLKTRPLPTAFSGNVDVAVGSFGYRKVHLWTGHELASDPAAFGFLLEGVQIASDGFKDLDGGGDTGFVKTEAMFKGGLRFGADAGPAHRIVLKLGYSDEESDETYLGLTDEDFSDDPYRRYRGSQLDRMRWDRLQAELFHTLELGNAAVLETAVYHHDFARVWRKLNRFRSGPDLNTLLANPDAGTNAVYYAVLTGAADSSNSDEHLMIGTNDREFVSQGIQTEFRWALEDGRRRIRQAFRAGVRLHRDEAVRFHTEDAYRMEAGRLVFNGDPRLVNTDTTGVSEAAALHAAYTHRFGPVTVTPRLRGEFIRAAFEDHRTGEESDDFTGILLPGLRAAWEFSEGWALSAGAHRGFSPKAPGQDEDVDPEDSVNYELGLLFSGERTRASVTAFFNDYDNLTAEDTFAGGGSGTGEQFNGGEVHVYGLEAAAGHRFEVAPETALPVTLAYTFMQSEFRTTFSSDNPQFGDVESGDELPYLPEHQLTLSAGVEGAFWGVSLLANYIGWMREQAGRGDPDRYHKVPSRVVFDVTAFVSLFSRQRLYVNVLNLFDEEYVVSHRPYGARPGLPRQIQVGFEVGF
ncbi:MAG TPA: TonB-dependent receptor [Planctomycetota bacterium]|nr:TonB-dependent receptor [Planctomycetota bacterium]